MLNELISPLTTPYMLLFHVRPRALDIVDFFRNFTVSVVGVGDVCSFAQMDVRKHGNPDWQTTEPVLTGEDVPCETNQYTQGEHGKTELSLFHFTLTNPGWKMPVESKQFVHGIRRHAMMEMDAARICNNQTAMEQSLFSVGSMGGEVCPPFIYNNICIMQLKFLYSTHLSFNQCSKINAKWATPRWDYQQFFRIKAIQ